MTGTPSAIEPRPQGIPEHLAMIRLSALGDVTLTTGVLRHWLELWGLRFTVITRKAFAPVFDNHPAVERVIALGPEDLRGKGRKECFQKLAEELSAIPLVDLHGTLRTRLLGMRWKEKVYRYPKHSVARRLFLLSGGKFGGDVLRGENVPQRYARALPTPQSMSLAPIPATALRPRVYLTTDERDSACAKLSQALPSLGATKSASLPLGEKVVALHPFATHAAKTWPPETWLAFAALLEKNGIRYFWVGKRDESPFPEAPYNFINQTGLRDLTALLAHASVLVTGDSGPMHLAAGVDTDILALFGPTCREWGFFPAGPHDVVLQDDADCRPCSLHGKGDCAKGHACLAELAPTRVLESLRPMLRR